VDPETQKVRLPLQSYPMAFAACPECRKKLEADGFILTLVV
jgi:hypothetical protein